MKTEPCAYEEECQHPACNCGKFIEPFKKDYFTRSEVESCIKDSLQAAADNAKVAIISPCVDGCIKAMACEGRCTEGYPSVYKNSILDTKNIKIK